MVVMVLTALLEQMPRHAGHNVALAADGMESVKQYRTKPAICQNGLV
jgi:hypothetical protein